MAKNKAAASPGVIATQGDWQIKSRGEYCFGTGRSFEDGETFYSRLIHTKEGYQREDYARDAWTKELSQDSVSFWKSVFQVPPPPKPDAMPKENAEATLRRLLEEDEPAHLNTIFVLAVMLERKRILVERDVQDVENQLRVRIYEHKLSGEAFIIQDPDLDLRALAQVQEEVAVLMGWKKPEEEGVSHEAVSEDTQAPAASVGELFDGSGDVEPAPEQG